MANVQLAGIVVFSRISMRCPLSLMYEFTFGTNGCRWRSISCDIFSVGPPQPLTIGLTAMEFLWNFFRKYPCCVLGVSLGGNCR